jgi:hypothetical protein
MKTYIYVKAKNFDGYEIKKVYISNPENVWMTLSEFIQYKEQQIEITHLISYNSGESLLFTHGVKPVIISSNKTN